MSAISTRLAVLGIIVGLVAVTVTPVRAGSRTASEPTASDDVTLELARAVVGAPNCEQPSVANNKTTNESRSEYFIEDQQPMKIKANGMPQRRA